MHGLGPPDQKHLGPEGFKPFWTQLCGAFPGIRFTIHNVIADGEWVAIRWTAEATHEGDHLGVAPTGKPVSVAGMGFARIVDGKIKEAWNSWDQLNLTRELGLPV